MPAYWILISIAAYRAIYQLMYEPYLWEKTDHTARGRQDGVAKAIPALKRKPGRRRKAVRPET
jgi:hypothetical protein